MITTSDGANWHFKRAHGEKNVKCAEEGCEEMFTTIGDDVQHFKRAHGEKHVKCAEEGCPKLFTTIGDAVQHFKTVHRDAGLHLYEVEDCNKTFSAVGALKQHQLIHTGMKPHVCLVGWCTGSFRTKAQLVKHEWHHTTQGMQSKKKQEEKVAKFLTSDGLHFVRDNFTSHSCIDSGNLDTGDGKATWAYHDFVFYGIHTIVFLEVDEHQVSVCLRSHEFVDALAFDLTSMLTYADVC